ncbi:MAG: hypothetical protein ABWY49_00700 [Rhizobium sp.]
MSHVSSSTNSSYPYRGTLLRLDVNGDGILSNEELAAEQRPGLLAVNAAGQASNGSGSALGSLIAKLMQLPTDGKTDVTAPDLMQPGAPTNADTDTAGAMDLYRGTYGQYDVDDMAA